MIKYYTEENCNYYIWSILWWYDFKFFENFNIFGCLLTIPCKIPFMTIWGIFCIPIYKLICSKKNKDKKYKKFTVYHI